MPSKSATASDHFSSANLRVSLEVLNSKGLLRPLSLLLESSVVSVFRLLKRMARARTRATGRCNVPASSMLDIFGSLQRTQATASFTCDPHLKLSWFLLYNRSTSVVAPRLTELRFPPGNVVLRLSDFTKIVRHWQYEYRPVGPPSISFFLRHPGKLGWHSPRPSAQHEQMPSNLQFIICHHGQTCCAKQHSGKKAPSRIWLGRTTSHSGFPTVALRHPPKEVWKIQYHGFPKFEV